MGKGYNHHDYMDIALAPIEAQIDDALEELAKVQAENAALLAAMEEAVSIGTRWWRMAYMNNVCAAIEGMRQTLKRALAKAKGGE